MKKDLLLKTFAGFCVFYLLIVIIGRVDIAWFLKPFLLPFLLLAVYQFEAFPTRNLLLAALTFSWIGDIILLFSDRKEIYFILGLVSFLISHLVYIVLFLKQKSARAYLKNILFWFAVVAVFFYLDSLMDLLYTSLGPLKLPVTVYAITISVMLIVALKGYFSWEKPANILVFLGAVAFVASDSLLAVNKFYEPIPQASFWIMSTYLIAQFSIVVGLLKLNSVRTKS